jgi:hypothetical protein
MKLHRLFFAFLISFAAFQFCYSQTIEDGQPSENWLKQYNIYPEQFLYQRFDRYSKEDIVKFREKLEAINNSKSTDEWEGIYSVGYDESVGLSQFRWKSDVGFVNFYIYTCLPELRHIGYGKIINSPDSIQLLAESVQNSPRKQAEPIKYVKVKWSGRHYLVEESSLLAFAEKAAGIYVEPKEDSNENPQKWSNNWVKDDSEESLVGLPEFPTSYKKFQRLPIETKITSIGRRIVEEEKTIGNATYYNSAFYTVTIGAGKDKGVKEGMIFDIPEIEDSLQITQVNAKSAIGFIVQNVDENKNDNCVDDNGNKTSCPKIKNNLKVKTQVGIFY